MSYPGKYTRQYDYVSYQNTNPARPLPAPKVHADLNLLASISDDTVEFLKLFSRADGALANGSVGYDQLSASLQTAGLAPAAAWVTATVYVVGNNVVINSNLYRCLVSHTSGVFADDLAAAKWVLVSALPINAYLAGTGLQLNTLTFSIDATVATLAGAQVLTNKTLTAPTLTAPVLGTPASGNLANTTGYALGNLTGAGTGVLAALAINVGSAGAPVTFNGALGTPSSGVATNLTGTAAGLTAGTFTAGSAANLTSGTLPAARTNGHMNGTATNDNAAAGEVGEYQETVVLQGSAVALTTNIAKDIAVSPALAAGDWEISMSIGFIPAASTSISLLHGSLSTVADTANTTIGRYFQQSMTAFVPGAVPFAYHIAPYRFSSNGSQTVRAVALATFTVAGLSAFAIIRCRRAR